MNESKNIVDRVSPGISESRFGIALGIRYGKKDALKLLYEFWIHDGTQWIAAGLPDELDKRGRNPNMLAALFAAAELARREKGVRPAWMLGRESNKTVVNFAVGLIDNREPRYLLDLDCFAGQRSTAKGHWFFRVWLKHSASAVGLCHDYRDPKHGTVLFYRLPDNKEPDEFSAYIGSPEGKRFELSEKEIHNIFDTFSVPTRVPRGAAEKGSKRCHGGKSPQVCLERTVSLDVRQYAKRLRTELIADAKTESLGTLDIEKAFPIRLTDRPDPSEGAEYGSEPDSLLESGDRTTVVRGYAGQGKSTLLRNLCLKLCNTIEREAPDPVVPIFVHLGSVSDLASHIAARISSSETQITCDECRNVLRQGRWLLFADAFDEVADADRRRVENELNGLIDLNPDLRIITSARIGQTPLLNQSTRLSLKELEDENDKIDFLKLHGVEASLAQKTIQELSRNGAVEILGSPLLLWMIAILTAGHLKTSMPTAPGALIKELIEHRLFAREKSNKRRRDKSEVRDEDIVGALSHLAFRMIDRNMPSSLKVDFLTDMIREYYSSRDIVHAGTLARMAVDVCINSGLLVRSEDLTIRFRHGLFRDYFAASHIESLSTTAEGPGYMESYCQFNKWDQVIGLLCGRAPLSVQMACIDVAVQNDPDWAFTLYDRFLPATAKTSNHVVRTLMDSVIANLFPDNIATFHANKVAAMAKYNEWPVAFLVAALQICTRDSACGTEIREIVKALLDAPPKWIDKAAVLSCRKDGMRRIIVPYIERVIAHAKGDNPRLVQDICALIEARPRPPDKPLTENSAEVARITKRWGALFAERPSLFATPAEHRDTTFLSHHRGTNVMEILDRVVGSDPQDVCRSVDALRDVIEYAFVFVDEEMGQSMLTDFAALCKSAGTRGACRAMDRAIWYYGFQFGRRVRPMFLPTITTFWNAVPEPAKGLRQTAAQPRKKSAMP